MDRPSRALIGLLLVLALVGAACTGGDDPADDPEVASTDPPVEGQAVPTSEPLAPGNPQRVADTAAKTLASIFANNDAVNASKYRDDIFKQTGCHVSESDVAYTRGSAKLERRARLELIRELTTNEDVTAVAYARQEVRAKIQPTIGDTTKDADLIAVVVALVC